MIRFAIAALSLCLVACGGSGIKRNEPLIVETLHVGEIIARIELEIDTDEKRGGRAAIGFLAGGILVGIGAAITEGDIGSLRAWEYTLNTNEDREVDVISMSDVKLRACVEVISTDSSALKILGILLPEKCEM